ncbi:hypothetical protein GCM10017597_13020 [Brachybacterium conglomeratum]|nr:hypothetical protein GCM10017597_13020 [Brachybacterium conglomeratum]
MQKQHRDDGAQGDQCCEIGGATQTCSYHGCPEPGELPVYVLIDGRAAEQVRCHRG